ncbi:MAG: hypothetical protein I3J02_01675 [Prevotella sp.]|nr:hypothetical protein [Prevotella sp.]
MKKLFTLIAAVAMATSMNAQVISFGEVAVANADLPAYWQNGDVKLTLANDGKPSIDTNTANFGTADEWSTFNTRLKTGGKSSSSRFLTLTVPSDGTVKIAGRTGSNTDNTRTIVLTQNDTELLNYTFDEANAVTGSDGATKVYPYAQTDVKAGDIVITFPINGINIYGVEFIATTTGINTVSSAQSLGDNAVYNLAGQKVDKNYKGVVIANGKKAIQK